MGDNGSDNTAFHNTRPPHRELVEVEYEDEVIRIMAIWGSDGVRPHWTDKAELRVWASNAFPGGWRRIAL